MITRSGSRFSTTIRTSPSLRRAPSGLWTSFRPRTPFSCGGTGCTLGASISIRREDTSRFWSFCSKSLVEAAQAFRPARCSAGLEACRRMHMAAVRIPEQQRTLTTPDEVRSFLAVYGIEYEQWHSEREVPADAPAEAILLAYKDKVDELNARGGYTTADVIDVKPDTPSLDAMLAKFSREHWHDEDEVRFIVSGRGVFHVHHE